MIKLMLIIVGIITFIGITMYINNSSYEFKMGDSFLSYIYIIITPIYFSLIVVIYKYKERKRKIKKDLSYS